MIMGNEQVIPGQPTSWEVYSFWGHQHESLNTEATASTHQQSHVGLRPWGQRTGQKPRINSIPLWEWLTGLNHKFLPLPALSMILHLCYALCFWEWWWGRWRKNVCYFRRGLLPRSSSLAGCSSLNVYVCVYLCLWLQPGNGPRCENTHMEKCQSTHTHTHKLPTQAKGAYSACCTCAYFIST